MVGVEYLLMVQLWEKTVTLSLIYRVPHVGPTDQKIVEKTTSGSIQGLRQ